MRVRFEAFSNAYRNVDLHRLDAMLADEYLHINNGGKPLDKKAWMNWNRQRRQWLDAGQLKIDRYDTDEIQIVVKGDTAVIVGRIQSAGTRQGKPFEVDIRFTNVWVKRGGTWLRLAFHDAPSRP
ncbi:nuclear transport factor 2 family protein [Sulfidibacter corallicola]|uniref:Nuclear transport factor 2 family protein n=1 Tax=Sulfidibacter corallicola TaxID=2818388 RepID=A0A8A4TMR8_SULCO|nr:nuclear transport factor 2 family protein [Sulfidibacter corallicola]QTD50504.1 nuclear transport factor 2 family protein [Sulfidibacter corallicola]